MIAAKLCVLCFSVTAEMEHVKSLDLNLVSLFSITIYVFLSHKFIQIFFLKPFRFSVIKLDSSDSNVSDKFDIIFFS